MKYHLWASRLCSYFIFVVYLNLYKTNLEFNRLNESSIKIFGLWPSQIQIAIKFSNLDFFKM